MEWKAGDRLTHRENPGLGIGRILSVSGRTVEVEFPAAGERLRLAATSPALVPLELRPGQRVRRGGREGVVAEVDDDLVRLNDGTECPASDLWPIDPGADLVERLASGNLDSIEDFAARLDALHLSTVREARGLGSFLGGRIRLFPHQLHVARLATAHDPVRWLLADEVGLGKTVEACLVLNRLIHRGGVERCLIVAPETLTVQWLGELWRKHHQVFVLLDEDRLADVAKDFGAQFNPFDAHRRVVVSMETLVAQPRLTQHAVQAGIDVLVVDEAHRLRRPRGHPGTPAYRAIEPMAAVGRHVLLLTATPLEDDAHGFFRLLQLLRPDELTTEEGFEERLARQEPLPPCTSSTRRVDVGGLPPRVPVAVDLPEAGWTAQKAVVDELRSAPAGNVLEKKRKAERLQRALASGASLTAVLGPEERALRALAGTADGTDPRLAWLVSEARGWKEAGEKTLVFVAHIETLELVRTALSHRGQLASAAFHEQLSPARRDIEVAQFRLPTGASLLVSTECGGEGRNFEFCHRLVLFDLPWNPVTVEQRIGRLDRIGRTREAEIVYFRPPADLGGEVVRVFEEVGLFREPLAGLEPELASLGGELAKVMTGEKPASSLDRAVSTVDAARTRIREAAYQELHRDRFRPDMGAAILTQVPPDLDELNQDVVTSVCERLGFGVEPHAGRRIFSFELGNEALVDQLPGVPGGSSFLGTFDREEAVADETLDFYGAGHPLVEGVLAHLEETARGRVCLLRAHLGNARGVGLLALYRDEAGFTALAIDPDGRPRPDWAKELTRRPFRTARVDPEVAAHAGWRPLIARLAASLEPERSPVALAALLLGP